MGATHHEWQRTISTTCCRSVFLSRLFCFRPVCFCGDAGRGVLGATPLYARAAKPHHRVAIDGVAAARSIAGVTWQRERYGIEYSVGKMGLLAAAHACIPTVEQTRVTVPLGWCRPMGDVCCMQARGKLK